MTKSLRSPDEQARLKAVRDGASKERKDDKIRALSDQQRVEVERARTMARLKALRLASEAATRASVPPPGPAKPRAKALRPGQAPNTRRSITR